MENKTTIPKRPKYAKLFLIVLSIYTAIFLGYQIFAICSLNSSQDKIKNYYLNHIERVDSLYCNLGSNNKAILSTYMQDSIYNRNMELLYMEYEKVLKEDSLRLYNERSLVEMQTKTMIDLHLNKVEHEYSNLTMWAAILTILFLVFSFYSIYKMDELILQGDEGVKEIKSLRKEGKQDLEQLKKEKEEIVTNIQGQLRDSIAAVNNTQKETERQYQNAVINLNSAKDGLITESKEMLEDYKKQFDSILKKNNDNLEQKQKEFNDLVTQVNEILNKLNNTDSKKEE